MGNFQAARQARGFGNGQQQTSNKQQWQDALQAASMAALAKGADTQTMLGFALGKWLSNYLGRGQEKKDAREAAAIANGVAGSGAYQQIPQQVAQQSNNRLGTDNNNGYYVDSPEGLAITQGLLGDGNSMRSVASGIGLNDDYYRSKNGGFFAG